MKEIVIISGKGGTGKTVVTAALASLAASKVIADCDVDAADMHLLLKPRVKKEGKFRSGFTAVVDKEKCISCGKCREFCRFSAVSTDFTIDSVSCEGCGFCSFICPAAAIKMKENLSGKWFISDSRFGSFVHAALGIAEENSGKLVSLVKEKAKELAGKEKASWIIVDGSPGIGCPVIASLSGADCAVVVTEPTLSGLADAERVISVARHFKIPVRMIINKFDLNLEVSSKIEAYCRKNNISLLGRLPFDKSVVEAVTAGKTLIEAASGKIKEEMTGIWSKLERDYRD